MIHWKIYTADQKARRAELCIAERVNENRLLRIVFKSWVRVSLFLTTNYGMDSYEDKVELHRKRVVFRRIKKAAVLSQSDLLTSLNGMKVLFRIKYFGRWIVSYKVCKFEQVASKRRFFAHLRRLSLSSRSLEWKMGSSIRFRSSFRLRRALRYWRTVTSLRIQSRRVVRAMHSASAAKSRMSARFSRAQGKARYVLMRWATLNETSKRLRLLVTLALRFRKKCLLRYAINRLKLLARAASHTTAQRRVRRQDIRDDNALVCDVSPVARFANEKLLRFALIYLKDYTCARSENSRRHESSLWPAMRPSHITTCHVEAQRHYIHRLFLRNGGSSFKYWLHVTKRRRVEQYSYKHIVFKLQRNSMSSCFASMRGLYSKRLCWRMKASLIDQSELFSQLNLLQSDGECMLREISDTEYHRKELEENTQSMK